MLKVYFEILSLYDVLIFLMAENNCFRPVLVAGINKLLVLLIAINYLIFL